MTRHRDPAQLALRLSATAALAGIAFALIGAWLAAWISFGAGLACAAVAYGLGRR